MKKLYFILLFILPVSLVAQSISVKIAESKTDYPVITWFTTGPVDTTAFQIIRANVRNKLFTVINTIHYTKLVQDVDTIEFTIIDTTLTEKGIYLYYLKVQRSGKTIISETALAHNYGLIPSPQLLSFKANPVKDRKAVRLEWKLSSPEMVNTMELFRGSSYDTGYIKVADLAPDMSSFIDVLPVANEPWLYFMVIHTYFGNSIASVRIPAFATFAEKPFKPHNIHGAYRNDSIILDWTNVGKNIIGYRVYRSIENRSFRLINDMNVGIDEKIVFADVSNEMKNNTRVSYYVRNVSDGFVESNSSDTLSFYLANHEPVYPPKEADVIKTQEGSFKLLWVPPDEGVVLAYNIYVTLPDSTTIKLNDKPLQQNYYDDTVYRSTGKYRYEIEGVGYNDKASSLRIPVTVYRYKPQIHVIIDIKRSSNGLLVSWKHPLNKHINKLLLYKQSGKTKSVLLDSYAPIRDVSFTDKNVTKGNTYLYSLKAQMVNGDKIDVNDGVQLSY